MAEEQADDPTTRTVCLDTAGDAKYLHVNHVNVHVNQLAQYLQHLPTLEVCGLSARQGVFNSLAVLDSKDFFLFPPNIPKFYKLDLAWYSPSGEREVQRRNKEYKLFYSRSF